MDNQLSVPTEAVLGAISSQRNSALDELAKAHALIEQLMADNERLRTAASESGQDGA